MRINIICTTSAIPCIDPNIQKTSHSTALPGPVPFLIQLSFQLTRPHQELRSSNMYGWFLKSRQKTQIRIHTCKAGEYSAEVEPVCKGLIGLGLSVSFRG